MLSTEHLVDDRKRIKNLGLGTYLVKPVNWSSLRESIQQVLGHSRDSRDERGDPPTSPEEIAELAHDVKGASGSYGFEHVQNMAEAIESLARDQQLNGIPSRAQDIQEHLDQLTVTYV